MKMVVFGGTGQVGGVVRRYFEQRGHQVEIVGRRSEPAWDGRTLGPWAELLEGAEVAINLAGRSVDCRYNRRNRAEIMDSRVDSTRVVGEAIAACERPPRLWMQASTATIYAHRYDAANDEATGIIDGGENMPDTWRFSVDVAKAWEAACLEAEVGPETRRVLLRTSLVMSPDRGGVFDVLARMARRGLGGRIGDGRQYVSWIHGLDFTRALDWIIEHEELDGAINLAAPNPLPNADFMRELRRAAGAWFGPPAPRWALELGTRLLRTESELVLKSRRVAPGRLLESGFGFDYPEWSAAVDDLCARWRGGKR